ncbi:MAG: hypothetical protein JKY56_25800, partial [Kofleriaceae bacterium]|nr:hypothetical protein [Kofleriaceae bacterium]
MNILGQQRNSSFCSALLALAGLALVASACGSSDSDEGPKVRAECNPLGDVACLLPWPSSAYMIEDSTSATGFRVDLPAEGMPINADNIAVLPDAYNAFDGFPMSGTMIAGFPTGVSDVGLPTHTDVSDAMAPNASVVVVNMTTGERLLIFAEPDMNAKLPEDRALLIRPLERMDSGTRYAVGIRNTVKAADGSALPVPAGFASILAGEKMSHPRAARIEDGYGEIFSKLGAAGMPKEELVLAWDFVTVSDDFVTQDILSMRDQALVAMESKTFTYEFEDLRNDNPAEVLRMMGGTYEVPNFRSNLNRSTSDTVRDTAGLPKMEGFSTANVGALVPRCVETAPLPIPVIIFGHGMFGSGVDSLDHDFLQQLANDECVMFVGGDLTGLTDNEFASVAFAMNDINKGIAMTETLAQSVVDFIVLQKMLSGPYLTADEFMHDGQQIIDPTKITYFGASLGGIMGGVYMSYAPDITRGVLGVPGGPWGLLFERSVFWPPLRIAMIGAYPEPWDYELNIALLGMLFEKVDPIATSHRVLDDPLPNTTPKDLLLYMAMGDALVANMASDVYARSLNIPVVGPSLRVPFSMEEKMTEFTSGYTIYDEVV